jgi:hypothetical protein
MRETLEALYFGNLHPTETTSHKNSRYRKVAKQTHEAYDKVISVLSDAQRNVFDTFVSMQLSTQAEGELEAFILGYRTGTRLLLDAITDGDFSNHVTIGGGSL